MHDQKSGAAPTGSYAKPVEGPRLHDPAAVENDDAVRDTGVVQVVGHEECGLALGELGGPRQALAPRAQALMTA